MNYSRSETDETTFESRQTGRSTGCLSGFLIPPLVVLCFGVMLTMVTRNLHGSGVAPGEISAEAASITQAQAPAAALPAPSGDGTLAPLFTPEVQHWSAELKRWGAEHGLDPNLAATVMQIESCGNPSARSGAGAAGLFQVMPFHFYAYEDAYDPNVNALRGMNYLASSLKTAGGDARLALAGYNGGIGVIARSESSWPAETQRYAYWGSGIYNDAAQNASQSSRLDEWLRAGGASLCSKARERLGIAQ